MFRRLMTLTIVLGIAAALSAQDKKEPKKMPPKKGGAAKAPKQMPLPPGIKAIRDIDYGGANVPLQKLDLYVPENGEKRPLIVWIHGGGWKGGDKAGIGSIAFVLSQGYSLASVNYRLTDTAQFPAQIHDCKGAIRFLRASASKYGYDAMRIGIGGSSAGGHLVALLGTSGGVAELEGNVGGNLDQSSTIQAVLDHFGPVNFVTMVTQQSTIDRTTKDYPEALLIGARVQDAPDKAKAASPVSYVDKSDPAFLIYQGDKDPLVPFQQGIEMNDTLKKAGVETELVMIPGGGHGGKEFFDETAQKKQLEFFDKHIKAASK